MKDFKAFIKVKEAEKILYMVSKQNEKGHNPYFTIKLKSVY